MTSPFYREGEKTPPKIRAALVFAAGGLGDFICWAPAVRYIDTFHPHISGGVFVNAYAVPLLQNLLRNCKRFKVYDMKEITKMVSEEPETYIFGNNEHNQFLNAIGAHLVDTGFAHFANHAPPPAEANISYCKVDTSKTEILHNYADRAYYVMTPGATAKSRAMPAWAFNEIQHYLFEEHGLLPIYLGRSELTGYKHISFEEGYDFSLGLDLRDKTDLLQAAKIIEGAKFILGLDNGLLHLAACTETPIIFGYSVAPPSIRRPFREHGLILDIFTKEEKLSCTGCMSKIRFTPRHSFTECFYGDYKCLTTLFDENCAEWKKAADFIIKYDYVARDMTWPMMTY